MIDAIFSQPTYVATKKMMDATALRHQAIASNIAQIETPNYKRLDVAPDFSAELRSALATQDSRRIANVRPSIIEDTTAVARNGDGNTVELETELLNMNQNTVAHALETQLVTGTLLRMRLAITGRSA
jgi:flagellar basal-body rod protein FlgB